MFLSVVKGVWLGTLGILILAIVLIVFGGLLGETARRTLKRKLSSEYSFQSKKSRKRRFIDWLVASALDAARI